VLAVLLLPAVESARALSPMAELVVLLPVLALAIGRAPTPSAILTSQDSA